MQAIRVRFCGATNTKGSRYVASCHTGRYVHKTDHSRNPDANAADAAQGLAVKLGWTKEHYGGLIGGEMSNGDYVFVFEKNSIYTFAPDPVV